MKAKNKYMGMTHEQLLDVQCNVNPGKDCRQFHKALCKVEKEAKEPFWGRGMALHSRYPNLPSYIGLVALALSLLSMMILLSK